MRTREVIWYDIGLLIGTAVATVAGLRGLFGGHDTDWPGTHWPGTHWPGTGRPGTGRPAGATRRPVPTGQAKS